MNAKMPWGKSVEDEHFEMRMDIYALRDIGDFLERTRIELDNVTLEDGVTDDLVRFKEGYYTVAFGRAIKALAESATNHLDAIEELEEDGKRTAI